MWINIVNIANNMIGIKEGTPLHHSIIDKYNSIRPIPRGYKMSYTDSWCAAFVSVVELEAGNTKFPFECGVYEMQNALEKRGLKATNPKPGDIAIYSYSHCGIVTDVDMQNGTYMDIEGNADNQVLKRMHNINSATFYRSY